MGRVLDVVGERTPPSSGPPVLPPITGRAAPEANATTIGVFVYRGVSSNEVDEPVARLADRMAARVVLIGPELGPVHAVEPSRTIHIDHTPSTAPPIDVLVVPGGLGWKQVIDDPASRDWLCEAAASAKGILAMSTGSLLLGSVGCLEGRSATGHWLAERDLAALGATVSSARTASDDHGRLVTASGALAAMRIVDHLADQARWAQWKP